MRWLSSLAILILLSLWSTPQAFAVHDSRLSPLADTNLHAVMPLLQDALSSDSEDSSDQPPADISPSQYPLVQYHVYRASAVGFFSCQCHFLSCVKPRAPPITSLA